jgi:hypothetical protein
MFGLTKADDNQTEEHPDGLFEHHPDGSEPRGILGRVFLWLFLLFIFIYAIFSWCARVWRNYWTPVRFSRNLKMIRKKIR